MREYPDTPVLCSLLSLHSSLLIQPLLGSEAFEVVLVVINELHPGGKGRMNGLDCVKHHLCDPAIGWVALTGAAQFDQMVRFA